MSDCAVNQAVRESKHRGGAIFPSGFKGEINKNECPEKERRDVCVRTFKRKAPNLWSIVICVCYEADVSREMMEKSGKGTENQTVFAKNIWKHVVNWQAC